MTDTFKITPADVGRVAVDETNCEMEIVYVDVVDGFAVGKGKDGFAFVYNLNGGHSEIDRLTHWKPRVLEAPKRWWNVWRSKDGKLWATDHDNHMEAASELVATCIARIYAEHWHNHEEGTFHVPEDFTDGQ